MGQIRVGVAGWDYPDWNGTVYPAGPGRGFDRLAFIARFVDAIEINSSFYRPLDPSPDGVVARSDPRQPGAAVLGQGPPVVDPRFRHAPR